MAFALSFDEIVVTTFTASSQDQTLPIWIFQNLFRPNQAPVVNVVAAVLVWETLYGVDEKLQPQRQMVESEEVSSDGLTWTFRLRPGLKFTDGTALNDRNNEVNRVKRRPWVRRDPSPPT